MFNTELTEEDIAPLLSQIVREYQEGLNYVRPKRIQYRDRVIRWNKQKQGTDKININMIANAIDTLIATSYTDGLTVNFAPKDGWIGQERADNLNYMAEFDNNEDDYQQIYYQKEQDRYFFGVALRFRFGWDDTRKVPLFLTVNPLCWIPDPMPSQTGRFDGKGYRYHGFEMTTTIFDLKADDTYNKEALGKVIENYFSTEMRLNRTTYAQAYNYNFPVQSSGLKHNFSLDIYHHFCNYKGKKWIVTTTAERTQIIRIKEIKPVLTEEKKDPSLVQFPLILNYRKPRRNDPFGESVCDKLDNLQIAKSTLFNLNLIKAKKEALGGDFIWNSRLIKNKQDILKPTSTGRNIFVDTNEDLNRVGVEIPRSQIKADTFSMISAIEGEAKYNVNLDSQQMGVLADRTVTATESQIAQANQNIIGLLNNKINSWGDKHFWFERWRAYQENFSSADEKIVSINANFEYKSFTIAKDDFFTTQIPFINVGTRADVDGQKKQEQAFRAAQLAMFLQDPTTPEASKNIAKRMNLKCNGKTPNEINVLCPLTPIERTAYGFVEMVNLNIVPQSLLNYPPEAYQTFWVYIQKSDNTDAKQTVLLSLQNAMKNQSMGSSSYGGKFDEMANSNTNIAMSQQLQTPKSAPSRQDLQQ